MTQEVLKFATKIFIFLPVSPEGIFLKDCEIDCTTQQLYESHKIIRTFKEKVLKLFFLSISQALF